VISDRTTVHDFRAAVKALRAATGLTQIGFGRRLGFPTYFLIQRWESGVGFATTENLVKLYQLARELGRLDLAGAFLNVPPAYRNSKTVGEMVAAMPERKRA
jgi:transcriptional regulator with XRE-family HTH domain